MFSIGDVYQFIAHQEWYNCNGKRLSPEGRVVKIISIQGDTITFIIIKGAYKGDRLAFHYNLLDKMFSLRPLLCEGNKCL